jgi:hypothetical protein
MTRRSSQAMDDIGKLFASRLHTLMDDCYDTSMHADIEAVDAIQMIISCLLTEVVMGSRQLSMTREQFLMLCDRAHRIIVEEAKTAKKGRVP